MTVLTLMPSRSAMKPFFSPLATRLSTSEDRGAATRRLLVHKFRKLRNVDELTRWAQDAGMLVPVAAASEPAKRWEPPSRDALLRCLVSTG